MLEGGRARQGGRCVWAEQGSQSHVVQGLAACSSHFRFDSEREKPWTDPEQSGLF